MAVVNTMRAALIYPHQLFIDHPAIRGVDLCVLIEEPLFFAQYRFHAQKLILHRASMRHYADALKKEHWDVRYVESHELTKTGQIVDSLVKWGVTDVQFVDPCDDWLTTRLIRRLDSAKIEHQMVEDPHFLTSNDEFDAYARKHSKLFFTDFYRLQRQRLNILMEDGKPAGGKLSFDVENRKKLPRGLKLPRISWTQEGPYVHEAKQYVAEHFPQAIGDRENFCFPINRSQAERFLKDFLRVRLESFGQYEDAISSRDSYLFHSVLTPALNIGLLSPRQVVEAALEYQDRVPLNSLEGFVRQVIGWREYIRGVYVVHGRRQRTKNFWQHTKPMPQAFYEGTTGIEPVDTVIQRVSERAYCHHIERLMILGNFMLLCEVDPDAIYQWFMEFFIDSYDWVMVPNVYGMSQHADGGLITTKPYISGSSYILRMSDFRKGPWCEIWDALFWRFMAKHRDFFASNHRMSVLVSQLDKMGDKLCKHQEIADKFLRKIHCDPS